MFTAHYPLASVAISDVQPRDSKKYSVTDSSVGGETSNNVASIFDSDSGTGQIVPDFIRLQGVDDSVGEETANLLALLGDDDNATSNELSSLLANVSDIDTANSSESPVLYLDDNDIANGEESAVILLGTATLTEGYDSASGSESATKLLIPITVSADGVDESIVNLDERDEALGQEVDEFLSALITRIDSANGIDVKSLTPVGIDDAVGEDNATDLKDITDFIVQLEGLEDIEINLEGEL